MLANVNLAEPGLVVGEDGRFAESRMADLIDLLLTIGHIDGQFHARERSLIEAFLERVVLTGAEAIGHDAASRDRLGKIYHHQFLGTYQRLEGELASLIGEVPRDAPETFLGPRLTVRALTTFASFPLKQRPAVMAMVRALINADGKVTPAEQAVHDELMGYVAAAAAPATAQATRPITISPIAWNELKSVSHPLLDPLEQTYSPHPVELKSQLDHDQELVDRALQHWSRQRLLGNRQLEGITNIEQLPRGARFLDGFVHVMRPDRPVELVVLGDLHGCYGCLKAALLQSDFLRRVWLHQWDPANNPDVKLVLLGDYIDRGLYSFDGVLRTVLQLFVALPDHVIVLRGNHESFLSAPDGVYSAVAPAEALTSITPHVPRSLLESYKLLFDQMPTSFLFDKTIFVHGGIPRDDSFAKHYTDLGSLNHGELRFQMLWSDPSQADAVPLGIQRRNPRFNFGKQQFRKFMEKTGLTTMIRGHEKIDAGFEVTYDFGDLMLINLFSAGGFDNRDLPPDSSYRKVTPMAMTLRYGHGAPLAIPWPIYYQPFNFDVHNGFHRERLVLPYMSA
jgi:hypothetical protein